MDGVRSSLTKMEISEQFAQIFQNQDNTLCYQCGKKSKQWADTKHAVFFCLGCAANYKQLGKIVNVKSISLDLWNTEQLNSLREGGNKKFKDFLRKFDLDQEQYKKYLRTNAAHYYRVMIQEKSRNREIPQQPSYEEGQQLFKQDIPLTEMSSDQILDEAKQKLTWVGEKTKYYGKKAYTKVHEKVSSGELKQDAKKAADKVGETAKAIWGFIKTKVDQVKNPNEKKEEPLIKNQTIIIKQDPVIKEQQQTKQ